MSPPEARCKTFSFMRLSCSCRARGQYNKSVTEILYQTPLPLDGIGETYHWPSAFMKVYFGVLLCEVMMRHAMHCQIPFTPADLVFPITRKYWELSLPSEIAEGRSFLCRANNMRGTRLYESLEYLESFLQLSCVAKTCRSITNRSVNVSGSFFQTRIDYI